MAQAFLPVWIVKRTLCHSAVSATRVPGKNNKSNAHLLTARLHHQSRMFNERTNKEKIMNVQHKIFASVGIVLLAATAAFAQQVKTGQDRAPYLEPTVFPDGIE